MKQLEHLNIARVIVIEEKHSEDALLFAQALVRLKKLKFLNLAHNDYSLSPDDDNEASDSSTSEEVHTNYSVSVLRTISRLKQLEH